MMFRVEGVNYKVGEQSILTDVDATFYKGAFNAIIGPNGCGKSSLFKLLAKIQKPETGDLYYNDINLQEVRSKDYVKKVAFFFQSNAEDLDLTVRQVVGCGRIVHKKIYQNLNSSDIKIVDRAIKNCDLEAFEKRLVSSLSGGERQRVYLAMCLAQEPEVIFLDEPTNHLDIKYQYQLLNMLANLVKEQDITVVCILHDLNQVLKYSDYTTILKAGSIYSRGATREVLTDKAIREVFDVNAVIHKDENGYHLDYLG